MNKQIVKTAAILTAFALVCTAVVTLTHILTAPEIAKQKELAILKTLNEIIADELYDNNLAQDCQLSIDEQGFPIKVFHARSDDKIVASAIETIVLDGYTGRIDLIVALDSNAKVLGVRTTQHKETPGLGDKVELKKSAWILSFNDKEVTEKNQSQWQVKKDGGSFDQFTGATITPRAVIKGVKRTVLWFQAQQAHLAELNSDCKETS